MRLWPGSPAPAVPDLAHHAVALVQVSSLLVQGLGYQVHNEEGDLLTVNTVQDLCVLVPVPGQLCLRPRPRMETQPVSLVSRVEGLIFIQFLTFVWLKTQTAGHLVFDFQIFAIMFSTWRRNVPPGQR